MLLFYGMCGFLAMEFDTELMSWLNKRTERSHHDVILVDCFVFMLVKIRKQGNVRLTVDGQFHNRFWKAIDKTYNYQLFHPKKQKQSQVPLFQFYYHVAVKQQLITVDNQQGKISSRGIEFLNQPPPEQLAFLLNHIWSNSVR